MVINKLLIGIKRNTLENIRLIYIYYIRIFSNCQHFLIENFLLLKKYKRRIKMDLTEMIKALCDKEGITIPALERKLNFGNGVIYSWKKSSPSLVKIQKVAEYFRVSVSYLIGEDTEEQKEEQDIARIMFKIKNQLKNDQALLFNGELMDHETIDLLLQAIEQQERIIKMINKSK